MLGNEGAGVHPVIGALHHDKFDNVWKTSANLEDLRVYFQNILTPKNTGRVPNVLGTFTNEFGTN